MARGAFSAALALAATLLPAAQAGALTSDVANPRVILANVDIATILPVVKETGGVAEVKKDEQGSFITANYDGIYMSFYPSSCEAGEKGCKGLEIGVSINRSEFKISDAELTKRINAFHDQYVISRVLFSKTGNIAITRYMIADYGIPRGNLAIEIVGMADTVTNFFNATEPDAKPE